MSLFHNPREIRTIIPRKRKKSSEDCEVEEKYSCDVCSDEYDNETDLHLHRKSIHKVEMNQMLLDEMVCKTCIKKYESYEHLIKHIKTQHLLSPDDSEHIAREVYICDLCHLVYFNKHMLSIHLQYSHDQANKMKAKTQCPLCSKVIRIKTAWFHFELHLTRSIGCCPICLKSYKSQKELNSHMLEHAFYYRCNICQYDASNKNYFKTHMQAHESKEVCNVETKANDVVKHCFIPRVNSRRSEYSSSLRGLKLFELQICVLCRAICTEQTKADHILHYHVVHRVPEKRKQYACSCGEVFFSNILLRHHVFKMSGDGHRPCHNVSVQSSDEVKSCVNEDSESCVSFEGDTVDVFLIVENSTLPCYEMGAAENIL